MKYFLPLLLTINLNAFANTVSTKTTEVRESAAQSAAEVSAANSAVKKTADSQMNGTDADVAVTRRIRDRLTDTDGLSTRAQNITIVTEGKNVILKGEVDKAEEIKTVLDIAQQTATSRNIQNQLTVHK